MPDLPRNHRLNTVAASIARSRFLAASLLIHVALVGLLGSVVLFKAIRDEQAFTVASGPDGGFLDEEEMGSSESEDAQAEFDEPASGSVAEATSASQSAISSLVETSRWKTSASMERATVGSTLTSFTPSVSSTTVAGGGGRGGGGGMKSGSLFGKEIQAAKLGVVFDVSFSTHKTIDAALQEIQQSFSDAIIVLAPGCGMLSEIDNKKVAGKVLGGGEFMENLAKYQFDQGKYYMGGFLPALLEKNKNFSHLWSDGIRMQRIFVLHLERSSNPRTPLVGGTHLAFQFLAEKGVDTIWWFADFEDEINETVASRTARDLERRRIKVIQHDFDGGNQLESKPRNLLATITKGEVILGYKSDRP